MGFQRAYALWTPEASIPLTFFAKPRADAPEGDGRPRGDGGIRSYPEMERAMPRIGEKALARNCWRESGDGAWAMAFFQYFFGSSATR